MNCSTKKIDTGFWLSFQIQGDGSELFDYGLPMPNHYERANNSSYGAYWLLDGYFGTKKSREYLNDTISRLSVAFKISRRLGSPREGVAYEAQKLSSFSGLPSLRTRSAQYLNASKYDDNVFWAIKLQAIRTIRITGWLDRSVLTDWAFDVFLVGEHVKDKSTLRAKCRSVFEWYEARNWRVDERISTMSRIEGAAKARAKLEIQTRGKIQTAINVLSLYGTKITVRSLAEEAGVSKSTAQKYLNEIKSSGGLGAEPQGKAVAVELFTQSPDTEKLDTGANIEIKQGQIIPPIQGKKEKENAEYKARLKKELLAREAKNILTKSAAGVLLNRGQYIL